MIIQKEADFEELLIEKLISCGWKDEVLRNYDEYQLTQNWAKIIFDNNRGIDRLNDYPLTDGEMHQILQQVAELRTPIKLNSFITGKTVSIKRENPDDKEHFGKEISLKIFERAEVGGGQSRYQIAQQPRFRTSSDMFGDRRGDIMLLINGMPVIHIELKRSGIPASEAIYQIQKYAKEGVYTGIFSLVQVFVAMTPDETKYFANPGPEGTFNPNYYFSWADFNNEPINDWQEIAKTFLYIPMAHNLVGSYTVADTSDGVLKVMRSYQYHAANSILDKVSKIKWSEENQRGGYVWHTTGSGKTMTSFKSAQLIAANGDADKVVFLTDRIELGTQSLKEYRSFADENEDVQATENTYVLISKLKSKNFSDTLIVTSIQKMSRIKEESEVSPLDIQTIRRKRLVFIVDEAHRSTFGEMLASIKETFPEAVFFGFTGTPIHEENSKKMSTTATVFGNELHRYSIADGIRDGNVLGFDLYKVSTYSNNDLRKAVALSEAKVSSEEEIFGDPQREEIFYRYMSPHEVKMAGYTTEDGSKVKGIEDMLPRSQYKTAVHHNKVLEDMERHWTMFSHNGKFHAIFATASIREAIEYYRLMKERFPKLKISALFDPSIEYDDGFSEKEDALIEILQDYNYDFDKSFRLTDHAAFKKDVASRLAHKDAYKMIHKNPEEQLNVLIVVDQMLTGFDSKWINTLYLDKVMKYESIIQAFSRTNRLFGPDKPFGIIRYYRMPNTMEVNIQEAVKLYSGDKVLGLFVDKLPDNIRKMNEIFREIKDLYESNGVTDFSSISDDKRVKGKFVKLFNAFDRHYQAARVQGFRWKEEGGMEFSQEDQAYFAGLSSKDQVEGDVCCFREDTFKESDTTDPTYLEMMECEPLEIDMQTYEALLQRYKGIEKERKKGGDVPYELEGHLLVDDTVVIDSEYMNSQFEKYLKELRKEGSAGKSLEEARSALQKSFATLNAEDQKAAAIFIRDIERGDVVPEEGKTIRDYITEYSFSAQNNRIRILADRLGLDYEELSKLTEMGLFEANINEFGRYDHLKKSIDFEKAKNYLEEKLGEKMSGMSVRVKVDRLLRRFITSGGYELDVIEEL